MLKLEKRRNKYSFRKSVILFVVVLACCLLPFKSLAQLSPLSTQFFGNQYLANPAFAGIDQNLKLSLTVRKLWSGIQGSPATQSATGDYGLGKVGLGLNVFNDVEGLLHSTRAMTTYAYHIPLSAESAFSDPTSQYLHFGLSLGVTRKTVRDEDIIGNPNDPSVARYNARGAYFDGDFGVAYTSEKWGLQLAIPNLNMLFKGQNDVSDVAIFYFAIDHKMTYGSGTSRVIAIPKLAYRGIKGFQSLWDAGVNISFLEEKLSATTIYHSPGSITLGPGIKFNKKAGFSFMYTTASSAIRSYSSNGNFEANLMMAF